MRICPISMNYVQNPYFMGKKNRNNINNTTGKDSFERTTTPKTSGTLTRKYGLKPDNIEIKSATPILLTSKQKAIFIEKLLEAHELAKKNVETGNIVKLGFATNMCLSDDTWHLATNFNNTRNDISGLCGERSAVIVAYNDFLKKLVKNGNTDATQDDFKVKYLVMSSAKPIGTDKNASSPCADCLSWLNTTKFFDDDTKIVYLTKDPKTKRYCLEFKTLKEILPMRGRDAINSIPSREKASSLSPFVMSKDAERIIKEKNISPKDIEKTMQKAKAMYNKDNFAVYSQQNIGACIKTGDKYFSAPKIDWSKRWFVEPVEFAIAKSFEELGEVKMPDIIAYYGNNETICESSVEQDGIISLKTLGRIKALDGYAEPLIVLVNGNDEIDIHSINDFMPKDSTFKQAYLKS